MTLDLDCVLARMHTDEAAFLQAACTEFPDAPNRTEYWRLKQIGWRSAGEIIENWNRTNNAQEHATIIGQIAVKHGWQTRPHYRFSDVSPALYSPIAQIEARKLLRNRMRFY